MAAGKKYYATLDLKDAYLQVILDEDSSDTFSDRVSLYRFKRLPFGLSCSPAIFSRQMTQLLAPLMKQGWVKNYFDDVIFRAPDFDTLVQRLNALFKCFADNGVKLNPSKCTFFRCKVKFLGHKSVRRRLPASPSNMKAVNAMKPSTRIKEVCRFLGMCGFCLKHIPQFAKIAARLTNLTRKGVDFSWMDRCQEEFDELRAW